MQLISLNQSKKHKKDEDETMDTNNFVLDETVIFIRLQNLELP